MKKRKVNVDILPLSIRASNVLKSLNIETIDDFGKSDTWFKIAECKNCGVRTFAEISAMVFEFVSGELFKEEEKWIKRDKKHDRSLWRKKYAEVNKKLIKIKQLL